MLLDAIYPYGYSAIWPKYGHVAVSANSYMVSKVANMGVPEKAIKMQQYGQGIKSIKPFCEK